MKKRIVCLFLIAVLAITQIGCGKMTEIPETAEKDGVTASTTMELRNYQQTDSPWGTHGVEGASTIWCTGCGILAVCNAIHYSTGYFIDPIKLADWANENNKGFWYNGTVGELLYYSMSETFGKTFNFEVKGTGGTEENGLPCVRYFVSKSNEEEMKQMMIDLMAEGVTFVVYVKNHFIAINDYDYTTDKFLVWDCAAGINSAGGDGYGTGRLGITHTDGDWFTFKEIRGTLKNKNGSYQYLNIEELFPIYPREKVQLFHVERNDLELNGTKIQNTGKACNFTEITDELKVDDEIVLSGSYSSQVKPDAIGYRIDGGMSYYKDEFYAEASDEDISAGKKWCGNGTTTCGFKVNIKYPSYTGKKFEVLVKTGDVERVIWTVINK